jgi:hypothetical protein
MSVKTISQINGLLLSFKEDNNNEKFKDKLVRCLSESLMNYINDYDICQVISKSFIEKRIQENLEETLKYHIERGPNIYLRFYDTVSDWNRYHNRTTVEISYLATKRGIRDFPNLKNISDLKEIKNYDKQLISLKDKIDDIKKLPNASIRRVGTNNYTIKQSNYDTLVPTDKWGMSKMPSPTKYTHIINKLIMDEYETELRINNSPNPYL